MKKKVLGIGEVVLDKVHQILSFPDEGEKVTSSAIVHTLGGPVPSALILLSRLGMECTLAAVVADDDAGKIIRTILAKEGVRLIAQKSGRTRINTVLVNKKTGSRTIIKDTQKNDELESISGKLIQSPDCIVCDRHEPKAVLQALKDKRAKTSILMDPSIDTSPQTMELLKKMDVPIIPVETLALLFPKIKIQESAKKLSILLGKTTIVTMGRHGSAICNGDTFEACPPFPVEVVDSLGAGDIFRGGFAYGMLYGWNIRQCTEFANIVAALQCRRLGNSSAIPTKKEIMVFQKSVMRLSHSV